MVIKIKKGKMIFIEFSVRFRYLKKYVSKGCFDEKEGEILSDRTIVIKDQVWTINLWLVLWIKIELI